MGLIDNAYYRLVVGGVSFFCTYKLFYETVARYETTSGPSMFPTLPAVQAWSIVKCTHKFGRGIKVGDVVISKHPWFPGQGVGKRVIGMPGDYVLIDPTSSDAKFLNYQKTTTPILDTEANQMMIQVPEGHCWLGGDNIPWSRDSRQYGPVPLALIQGKVLGSYDPQNRNPWWSIFGKWQSCEHGLTKVEWNDYAEDSKDKIEVGLTDKEKDSVARQAQERYKTRSFPASHRLRDETP